MGYFRVCAIPFCLYILFLIDFQYMYIFTYETNKVDRQIDGSLRSTPDSAMNLELSQG